MNEYELTRLRAQLAILKEVAEEYGDDKSLWCVINTVKARINWNEKYVES